MPPELPSSPLSTKSTNELPTGPVFKDFSYGDAAYHQPRYSRLLSDQSDDDPDEDILVPSPYDSIDTGGKAWKTRLDAFYRFCRFKEGTALRNKYEQLKTTPKASFILITGPAGVGKTSLAKTLKASVEEEGGYFLRGKFDFLQRPEPYTAFVAAFTEFTNLVIARGEEVTKKTREAIQSAVGEEAGVLIGMIPSLERILGDGHEGKASDSLQRFIFVFRMFLRSVCSPEKPLVLLLDDLHFADPCSLDLLMSLVSDNKTENLVVVATVQDNVMSHDSYLSKKLRDMESMEHHKINHIALSNLDEQVVCDLLADVFQLTRNQCKKLATLVCGHTDGNLFYIKEMLRWLQDSDLLTFESARFAASCSWDEDEIRLTLGTQKAEELLLNELDKLPTSIQEMLKVAACLGPHLDESLLEKVLGDPVTELLKEAAEKGVIDHDEARCRFAFPHDELQKAAYRLIPESERELFHLEVGRRMWRKIDSADELDRNIYTLLSQMNIGSRLITRKKEQIAVATSCLHAGRKAAKSSTFRTAAAYLELGLKLLDERSWRENYDLAFSLHNSAAEMAMCTANVERMNELLDIIFRNARMYRDKVPAYALQIYGLGMTQRQQEGIDIGLEVLEQLGEKFPRRFITAHFYKEAKRIKFLLKGKSDEQILRMPLIKNEDKLACLKILHSIFSSVTMMRPRLTPLIVLKGVELTMKYGLSTFASVGFTWYGRLHVGWLSNDIDIAFRYGKLGIMLLKQFKAKEYAPRVLLAFYGHIYAWKKSAADTLEPLMMGHRLGLMTGDLEAAGFCASNYIHLSFEAGIKLDKILAQCSIFKETIVSSRLESIHSFLLPTIQSLHNFMGISDDPLSKKGDVMDYDEVMRSGTEKQKMLARVLRMMACYLYNDHKAAGDELSQIHPDVLVPHMISMILFSFIAGMVALACVRMGVQPRSNKQKAKRILRMLRSLRYSTPHLTLSKIFLLEGELASVCHDQKRAMERYTCAIALANQTGFGIMKGLANERAARHLWALGHHDDARPYFEDACTHFMEWGAIGKFEQLRADVNVLYHSI